MIVASTVADALDSAASRWPAGATRSPAGAIGVSVGFAHVGDRKSVTLVILRRGCTSSNSGVGMGQTPSAMEQS